MNQYFKKRYVGIIADISFLFYHFKYKFHYIEGAEDDMYNSTMNYIIHWVKIVDNKIKNSFNIKEKSECLNL